jgi:LmbE family N-acetylglucosaminyl deacetylase
MNKSSVADNPMRLLGVFAHPDDEAFCAGGTFAKYVAAGAEVMVISATRGEAGQIRSAGAATRQMLAQVREQELQQACQRLGIQHAVCLDYADGRLQEVEQEVLTRQIGEIIHTFQPDLIITFGPDGGYGHPDHIAISAATTAAYMRSGDRAHFPEHLAAGRTVHRPARLYHSHFPHNGQLLLERLAFWLASTEQPLRGTQQCAYAMQLLSEEATLLHYSRDHVAVNWYPAGFSIIEQDEKANSLYMILSGTAEVVREGVDGMRQVLARLGPGDFFGQEGLAYGRSHEASVVAVDSLTCLVFSPEAPTAYLGRGADASLTISTKLAEQDEESDGVEMICMDVRPYLHHKIEAIAAHRSQFPIQPAMLPQVLLQEVMGREYFVCVSPSPFRPTERS